MPKKLNDDKRAFSCFRGNTLIPIPIVIFATPRLSVLSAETVKEIYSLHQRLWFKVTPLINLVIYGESQRYMHAVRRR